MINGVGKRCRGLACKEVVSLSSTFCPKCVIDWQLSPERERVESVSEPARIQAAVRDYVDRTEREAAHATSA